MQRIDGNGLVGGWIDWLAACKNDAAAAVAAAGCCVSENLRAKTLREIKENMGQWESKKETLKNRKEELL
jgi:dienelactone hydrolase